MRLIFATGFQSHKSLSMRIRNAEALTVAGEFHKALTDSIFIGNVVEPERQVLKEPMTVGRQTKGLMRAEFFYS